MFSFLKAFLSFNESHPPKEKFLELYTFLWSRGFSLDLLPLTTVYVENEDKKRVTEIEAVSQCHTD